MWDKKKAILKIRKKKAYRNSLLDQKIRKQRTSRESQIISQVKSFGIPTPLIYFVDLNKCSIMMQNIDGKTVRDTQNNEIVKVCNEIGKIVGTISKSEKGNGWGFDPIFIPKNTQKTFGELIDKNNISHRYKALKKFSNWYLHK